MCTEVEAKLITGEGGSQKGGREGRGRGKEDAAGGWWSFKSRNGDSPLIWPFVNFRGEVVQDSFDGRNDKINRIKALGEEETGSHSLVVMKTRDIPLVPLGLRVDLY